MINGNIFYYFGFYLHMSIHAFIFLILYSFHSVSYLSTFLSSCVYLFIHLYILTILYRDSFYIHARLPFILLLILSLLWFLAVCRDKMWTAASLLCFFLTSVLFSLSSCPPFIIFTHFSFIYLPISFPFFSYPHFCYIFPGQIFSLAFFPNP